MSVCTQKIYCAGMLKEISKKFYYCNWYSFCVIGNNENTMLFEKWTG